jgi:UDP-N-acetyl-D-glucosamine dehydrogenase
LKISVIGQGYVGLTISIFAAEHFDVTGYDSNQKLVEQLNLGISHIEGVDSASLAKRIKAGMYRATNHGDDLRQC